MPGITLSYTDDKWADIQDALTYLDGDGNPVVPNKAYIKDWIANQVRVKVLHNEERKASLSNDPRSAMKSRGW